MKINFKKFLATITAITCALSSTNVFAKATTTIQFDENCNQSTVASANLNSPHITVTPSKDNLSVGEEFYVDFILENNPGFSAFGFTIDYDKNVIIPVKGDADELDKSTQVTYNEDNQPAVSAHQMNSAIDTGNSSGSVFYTNFLVNKKGQIVTVTKNGILFRLKFKAVAEGLADIILYDRAKALLMDSNGDEYSNIYVTNASVTVSNSTKQETTTEATTETTTETTTEKTITKIHKTGTTTERTTEATTEATTEKVTTVENESEETTAKVNTGNEFIINLPKNVATPRNFTDLSSVAWAKQSINSLSSLGIINGVTDVTFNPKAFTCRADFVVVISRLLGIDGNAENVFTDVPDSAYYSKAVALANKLDLVKGSNGKFMPKNNITRQDAMVILSRVLEKANKLQKGDESTLANFKDKNSISSYAVSAMADLVSMGIVKGDNNNMLNPKGNINRAEMAVVIDRIYDVLNK